MIVKYLRGAQWEQESIARDIDRALENEEFFLQYQPIINLQTNRLTGLEAFIRWNHPTRGILYPSQFMSSVEKTNKAGYLGEWIVCRACRTQCQWKKHWPAARDIGMHINISKSQFMDRVIFERIKNILQDASIAPNCIYLDCLKSSFLKNREQANLASNFCQNLGINLVLDDLKINLFNLNFFFDFLIVPFCLVKVNGNVVDSVMQENTTVLQSVRTFISILSGMGIKMAVKGIENQVQYQAIKDLNCHMGQGYFFSPPLSQQEFERQWFEKI